jgi:2-polyprenyl-6-hydroxyphenyl methylase/3-demethylubiquinone-9 3-methyltransferase
MRFKFGKNWQAFAETALSNERVEKAREDFRILFRNVDVASKTFFDIGFGQGLSLCIAAQLSAEGSGIDVDSDNLAALQETANRLSVELPKVWIGSILDDEMVNDLASRGGYDIVHSWGVLHHTGNMDKALRNAAQLVKPGGFFVIAIYRKHWSSPAWKVVKWLYNASPEFVQRLLVAINYWIIYVAKFLVTGKSPKGKSRGMDFYYDVVDWVGGYPYEYADANSIVSTISGLGFHSIDFFSAKVPTGCNEFVFQRNG